MERGCYTLDGTVQLPNYRNNNCMELASRTSPPTWLNQQPCCESSYLQVKQERKEKESIYLMMVTVSWYRLKWNDGGKWAFSCIWRGSRWLEEKD
ncbi:hypothetical protein AB3S75_013507 [Citrus x aurantiifolia]